jgi:hypothetical protein
LGSRTFCPMSTPTSEGRTRTGVKSRWWVLPTLAVLSAVPSVLLSTQWLRIPQAHTSSSSDLHRFLAPSAGLAHGHLTFGRAGSAINRNRQVMMVTANQPLPCQTRRGDWIMALALRNKLMYSTLHGYKTWWSTELVSAWDLEAAWNKIPLLYVLASPESPVTHGIECAATSTPRTHGPPLPRLQRSHPRPSPVPRLHASHPRPSNLPRARVAAFTELPRSARPSHASAVCALTMSAPSLLLPRSCSHACSHAAPDERTTAPSAPHR